MSNTNSKIVDVEIRACRSGNLESGAREFNSRGVDFTVITMTTSDRLKGTSFGFGVLDSRVAAKTMTAVRPFFIGRNPLDTELAQKEFENFDRKWNHVPVYAYGPFDNACWDIKGKLAGLPVYKLLGAAREKIALYVSSAVLESTDAYVKEALEAKSKGYKGYKIHPPGMVDGGKVTEDLEVYRAVRKAVGADFPLMADPVIGYTYEEALRVGRELEKLNYLWLEEPVLDVDFHSLRKLREKLDIPIISTEVLAGAHYSTATLIKADAVDIVRSDVSWRGGITAVMKTAHVAEAFGINCELHTTIYHALEMVQLHAALAISNTTYFEMCYPFEPLDFGTKTKLNIKDGYVHAPEGEGLCIEYDWDFIENHTVATL